MNKLKYLYLALFSTLLTACFDDAPSIMEQIESQPNTIGFVARSTNVSGIADGSEYEFQFPVQVTGPTTDNLSGTYTANVSVDPSSTAIEGVHYRLEETQITATEEEGYLSLFTVVMLTEGIETPLEENPVLILNVSDAEGPGNVIASGAQLRLEMLYLCPSYLAGEYTVFVNRSDNGVTYEFDEVITETGPGQFRTVNVGHYPEGALAGTPGFSFIDICGTITVPQQNLADYYSSEVFQAGDSYVDPVTGNIHIEYTITFAAGNRTYKADFIRKQ